MAVDLGVMEEDFTHMVTQADLDTAVDTAAVSDMAGVFQEDSVVVSNVLQSVLFYRLLINFFQALVMVEASLDKQ
jgi:hypothetical protein